tara:strand:- start:61 stop:351 length:291 start_codon:yes stop_codon:yes gene_type:complete
MNNKLKFNLLKKAVKTGFIFGAGFIKKDGTVRTGKFRGGVKIGVKGTGPKHNPKDHGHFKVYDMTINDFRKINSNTLFYIKFFDVEKEKTQTINII